MALSDGSWNLIATNDIGPPYGAGNYTEYEESGDFNISADDSTATKIYQVDDQYRLDFVDDLYGYTTFSNEAAGKYNLVRVLPEQHDEFKNFYCSAVSGKRYSVTGTTTNNGVTLGTWKMSRIHATFRPTGYDVLSDAQIGSITYTNPIDNQSYTSPNELNRFCTRTYHYVIQQLTVQGLMQFCQRTDNKALDTAPGNMIVYLEKEITWHQVPARQVGYSVYEPPNQATVQMLGGCLNSAAFDGHNIGTVVLVGYQPVLRKPNLDTGLYTWDITYRFLVMDHGQKTITDSKGNNYTGNIGPDWIYDTLFKRWDLVTSDGTVNGNAIYPTADLNALFAIQKNS